MQRRRDFPISPYRGPPVRRTALVPKAGENARVERTAVFPVHHYAPDYGARVIEMRKSSGICAYPIDIGLRRNEIADSVDRRAPRSVAVAQPVVLVEKPRHCGEFPIQRVSRRGEIAFFAFIQFVEAVCGIRPFPWKSGVAVPVPVRHSPVIPSKQTCNGLLDARACGACAAPAAPATGGEHDRKAGRKGRNQFQRHGVILSLFDWPARRP